MDEQKASVPGGSVGLIPIEQHSKNNPFAFGQHSPESEEHPGLFSQSVDCWSVNIGIVGAFVGSAASGSKVSDVSKRNIVGVFVCVSSSGIGDALVGYSVDDISMASKVAEVGTGTVGESVLPVMGIEGVGASDCSFCCFSFPLLERYDCFGDNDELSLE
jgi:ABC-type uncharacterized transport system permease subunit